MKDGEDKYPAAELKELGKALKVTILNIPEKVISSAVSSSPVAEILK